MIQGAHVVRIVSQAGHADRSALVATSPTGFWQQGGGYDRNIIGQEAAWASIEYIHNNPVRKGLAATPKDWEWSSARWYAEMRPVRLEMDEPPVPPSLSQLQRRPK